MGKRSRQPWKLTQDFSRGADISHLLVFRIVNNGNLCFVQSPLPAFIGILHSKQAALGHLSSLCPVWAGKGNSWSPQNPFTAVLSVCSEQPQPLHPWVTEEGSRSSRSSPSAPLGEPGDTSLALLASLLGTSGHSAFPPGSECSPGLCSAQRQPCRAGEAPSDHSTGRAGEALSDHSTGRWGTE